MIRTLAELTLVVVLFTDASRIAFSCVRREGSLPFRMLGIGLPLTIAAGTAGVLLLLPGFGWLEAALLAAILAPTDAALGQAVVSNPMVPGRIRQTLNVESGLNDGIALPVVLVLASLAGATNGESDAGHWLLFAALAVALGPLVGFAVGYVGGRWLEAGVATGLLSTPSYRRNRSRRKVAHAGDDGPALFRRLPTTAGHLCNILLGTQRFHHVQ